MTNRVVKFGQLDLTVDGKKLNIDDNAPNFKGKVEDLSDYDFYESEKGKVKIISSVPSLDTSICELQTFLLSKNEDNFPEDLSVITISNDLPFAQKRFEKEKAISKVKLVSDYLYEDFAKKYSLFINELKLVNRAIFVVDKDNVIRHVEYLDQNTELPDVEKALEIALSLTK
ncbi:thiol peroxidase [Anaerococcus martiniensis]|uniref:thiol peroxidase n=1 Tax=Anaerococcus sp. WGS1579 TaxID=3366809 RepID=UPI00372D4672